MQLPGLSHTTSHELPAQVTLPEQLLSPLQCTLQLAAPWQSTPLEHALWLRQSTRHATPSGHFTLSVQGCSASQVMTQTAPWHWPTPAHASSQAGDMKMPLPPVALPALPAASAPPLFLVPPVALLPALPTLAPPVPSSPGSNS
jgi:hypothetical protein